MKVSAVISTKDRLPQLKRCLDSLEKQTRIPDELIIIDADSDTRVKELIEARKTLIPRVAYHPFPSSLTQARNHGVKHSSGEIVVFLDDDLILEENFIQELVRPIEQHPHIAGVTGRITNETPPSSGIKRLLQIFFQLPYEHNGFFRLSGAPTTTAACEKDCRVEFVPGGLTAWRKKIFETFQFDESLPGLGINEDVDFSYRVSRTWENFYTAKARTAHERPSLEREATLAYLQMELQSLSYLFWKNMPKTPIHFFAFIWQGIGLFVRFAFRRWGRR